MGYIVYKHIFPNNKVYIGITSGTALGRWGSNGARYKGQLVYRAIKKYGWKNVKHEILATNLTRSEACDLEIALIKKYNSNDSQFGYNISKGGDIGTFQIGHPVSKETRMKISKAQKGVKEVVPLSEEAKERLRKLSIGRVKSKEEIEKIRKANIGRHHSEATKQKISEIQRNRTPEQKAIISAKLSASLKKSGQERAAKRKLTMQERYPDGFKQPESANIARSIAHKGKKKSEATKQKMRKPKSPQQRENMKKAQQLRREAEKEAKKLGLTYTEYKNQQIGGN